MNKRNEATDKFAIEKPARAIMGLWFQSATMVKKLDAALGTLHGIGFAEYMILNMLMSTPTRAMRRVDMAEAIGRTASGVTRMLMPMEKIGLVGKEINERDARVSLVKLTPAGKRLFLDATNTFNQQSASLLRRLSSEEVDGLSDLMDELS